MKTKYGIIFIVVFTFFGCMEEDRPLIIGHRGAMGHETENTLASIQKALDLGVDAIEIDVFNIASGETVVFHDERVEELTNGAGRIEEMNFSEVRRLVLDGGHRIPTLQEVLKLVDNKVRLNIELKGTKTADRVNHITQYYIKERGWSPENILISSFDWDELRDLRRLNPNVAIAVLTEEDPLNALPVAKELGAEAINPAFSTLNLEIANAIREGGFKIYTWTVNDPDDINLAKRWAVDGIITDYPDRLQ